MRRSGRSWRRVRLVVPLAGRDGRRDGDSSLRRSVDRAPRTQQLRIKRPQLPVVSDPTGLHQPHERPQDLPPGDGISRHEPCHAAAPFVCAGSLAGEGARGWTSMGALPRLDQPSCPLTSCGVLSWPGCGWSCDASGRPAQARPDDVGQHTLGGSLVAGQGVGPGLGRHGPVHEDPVTLRERLQDVVRQGLERPHDMAGQLGVDPFAVAVLPALVNSPVIPTRVNRQLRRGRTRRGARTSLARGPEPAGAHRACDLATVLGLDERAAAIANRDRSNPVQTGVLQRWGWGRGPPGREPH